MKVFKFIFASLVILGLVGAVSGFAFVFFMWNEFSQDLPDHTTLENYEPPITTRVYANDGSLIGEFAREKRVFTPIDAIPEDLIHAFLSAEDQNFYSHKGVDFTGVARAIVINFKNAGSNRRLVGASTITQQIAKNFLLTNEVSYERKIKEAILAFRLEQNFSKDKLLELYLNQIYLGGGAYGVAAAAEHYFNKTLDELTFPEMAYMAALPKAPNNYHPIKHEDAAVGRRNWVLGRMYEDNYIDQDQLKEFQDTPLVTVASESEISVDAPYFLEDVRRIIADQYGSESLYKGGLVVRSTLDPILQIKARDALRDGLISYDRRMTGYRGAVTSIIDVDDWSNDLATIERPKGMINDWDLAVILNGTTYELGLINEEKVTLDDRDHVWGGSLKRGDVVMIETIQTEESAIHRLRQVPQIQGAIIALDPDTGRVLAMSGGWDYELSEFNRATQALRQTGSAFKPFIYAAGLAKGLSPSTLISDGPLSFDAGPGQDIWRPKNYNDKFMGNITLRVGLEKSRNLVTVRLAQHVGMKTVSDYARMFGVKDDLAPHLANSLGSAETTLLKLTSGYATFDNGGRKVNPSLIDRVQNRHGETVFNESQIKCVGCGDDMQWRSDMPVPELVNTGDQIIDAGVAYQVTEILHGVAERGTAVRLRELNRPIAGKTGTTNDSKDTWFIGYTPDLVAGVFVGFDEPKSLGDKQTGSSVALPIFKDFMESALKDVKPKPFKIPNDVSLIKVDPKSGMRTTSDGGIWEPFTGETDPENTRYLMTPRAVTPTINEPWAPQFPSFDVQNTNDQYGVPTAPTDQPDTGLGSGTGGLY